MALATFDEEALIKSLEPLSHMELQLRAGFGTCDKGSKGGEWPEKKYLRYVNMRIALSNKCRIMNTRVLLRDCVLCPI